MTVMQMGQVEFFIGLITLAGLKFEMGVENPTWGYAELSLKVSHLLSDYVLPSLVPSFDERLTMLDMTLTAPHMAEVLNKGRYVYITRVTITFSHYHSHSHYHSDYHSHEHYHLLRSGD